MTRKSRWILLLSWPLLTAALWMDHQPSFKPYRAAAPPAPAGSVPVTGREASLELSGQRNPVSPDAASLALGKALFAINCALCHGASSSRPGPVGQKLTPPPPGLDHATVQGLGDADIFGALTRGFGRMPSFRDKLTPRERWSLVNFLRTRN